MDNQDNLILTKETESIIRIFKSLITLLEGGDIIIQDGTITSQDLPTLEGMNMRIDLSLFPRSILPNLWEL